MEFQELKEKIHSYTLGIETYPKIVRQYKFYQNPIKWIKDIKKFRIMNALFQYEWKNGLKEKVNEEVFKDLFNLPIK